VFKNIYCSLRQNGSFLIQILNYTAILKSNQRLINTTEDADNIFVRFYDFGLENINFNILRFSKKNIKDTQLITTKLYSHQSELLKEYLLKAGFNKIYFYADFKMNKYYKLKSKDLVVLSIK
ncbi:MAG: hypothetical protein N3A61_05070, partial [Ignavibacteria bacterium]|nr:hypothetical protein [Ignavibacteria bacterium]